MPHTNPLHKVAKSRSLVLEITNAVTLSLLPISLILFAYERALIPLYGSGPTTFLLRKFALGTVLASAIHPFKISDSRNWLYAALTLSLAPNTTYWVAVLSSRWRDPVFGPAFTHTVVLSPMIFIFATFVVEMDLRKSDGLRSNDIRPPVINRLIAAGSCYTLAVLVSQCFWPRLSYLNNISESKIFLTLAGMAYCVWAIRSRLSYAPRGKRTTTPLQPKFIILAGFIAIWWSLHEKLTSPVLPHPLKEPYTHPFFPLRIHSSVQSVTGLVVVGEALPPAGSEGTEDRQMHSVRYLRASHSILGGVWMGAKINVLEGEHAALDSHGTPLGDSIYSTFVLQEAARLVNSTRRGEAGIWDNALVIGLGAGISAAAFSRHGISTTIVEIDPAVYEAARRFFGLPDPGPGKVFLEDARSWATQKRASVEAGNNETLFDIVVHDCFSGGGVPEHIFTLEFWEDLKSVVQPEGVVVVNFAGILQSDSSRMVVQTLEKSFGQCRAFHDVVGEISEEKYETEFVNMVLFCTQSAVPLTFRQARRSDYLGSPLRRHVLDSLLAREVKLDLIRAPSRDEDDGRYILTDAHNPLGRLQDAQGMHHWALMREVFSDVYWETY